MKVYFSGTRFFADKFENAYSLIREAIKEQNCILVDMSSLGVAKDVYEIDNKEKAKRYKDFLKQLESADISMFEATYPSTIHIGHEITLAIQKGKPVIVLHKDGVENEPKMFRGLESDKVIWVPYNDSNLKNKVKGALEEAKKIQDVRFNFFVSPKHLNYLDHVAKKKMIPRAVFLRDLIEREMKKDKDFSTGEN